MVFNCSEPPHPLREQTLRQNKPYDKSLLPLTLITINHLADLLFTGDCTGALSRLFQEVVILLSNPMDGKWTHKRTAWEMWQCQWDVRFTGFKYQWWSIDRDFQNKLVDFFGFLTFCLTTVLWSVLVWEKYKRYPDFLMALQPQWWHWNSWLYWQLLWLRSPFNPVLPGDVSWAWWY